MTVDSSNDGWLQEPVRHVLADQTRFERVRTNRDFAFEELDRIVSRECEHVLFAASRDDWDKALVDAYDAARKAIEMLLLTAGVRVRNAPGAHAATVDVVTAWLSLRERPAPRIARSFGSSRRIRHTTEYPTPNDPQQDPATLRQYTLDAIRLMNLVRGELGLPTRDEVIPTETNVQAWHRRS